MSGGFSPSKMIDLVGGICSLDSRRNKGIIQNIMTGKLGKKAFIIFTAYFLMSCEDPFVNGRTSRLYDLNIDCVDTSAWVALKKAYPLENMSENFEKKLIEFDSVPFPCENIYFFLDSMPELIAVDRHDCVRYVYNPKISEDILDGLSKELTKKEKERIGNRIQGFLRKYQCDKEKNNRYVQEWDKDEN